VQPLSPRSVDLDTPDQPSRTSRRGFVRAAAGVAGGALALSHANIGHVALAQDATPQPSGSAAGSTPDLDPQMQDVLDELTSLNNIPLEKQTPFNARQLPTAADAVLSLLSKRGKPAQEAVLGVEHRLIPTSDGDLVARVYTPKGKAPLPVLVYFHGGGWVIANLNTYDASCRALANAAKSIVVSVAYRQAPENPFPAAADDAYNSFQYVAQNASLFNGDPDRVAVVGESAGGNLAAVTALLARDQNGILPVHQLLVYPITNYNFDTESYQKYATAKPLNKPLMQYFWANYLADPGLGADPSASPLQATDLSGLPPATVIAAEVDPLRSEGKAYADALKKAGVDVSYNLYKGVAHEFFGMGAVVDKAQDAVNRASDRLLQSFQEAGTPTP